MVAIQVLELSRVLCRPLHALGVASDGHGVRSSFYGDFDVVARYLKLVVLVQTSDQTQLLVDGEYLLRFGVHALDPIQERLLLVVVKILEPVKLLLVVVDGVLHEFAAGVGYDAATSTGAAETELGYRSVGHSRPSTRAGCHYESLVISQTLRHLPEFP